MLVADSVGKRYGHRWVLRSATLRAVRGELRALVGRNGAGKSTLLKVAAGLVAPDHGSVRWDEEHVERPSLFALAHRGLFFLPDHDLLSSSLSVRAHLEAAAHRPRGAPAGAAHPGDVAAQLRLEHVLESRPHRLSGGELRRAELAVAVLRRPRCLLADEPLRGISPLDTELLLAVLRGLAEDGCAVVVTGHEVPALFDAVDHVSWCTDGTTYELGPPALAAAHERFQHMYLGRR